MSEVFVSACLELLSQKKVEGETTHDVLFVFLVPNRPETSLISKSQALDLNILFFELAFALQNLGTYHYDTEV